MPNHEETLSTYLKRVMALKDERRGTPSEEDLRSIAREVGLSDEDLASIDQAAADHATRGQGFLEHQRYGDAITELEEAVAVAPRRVEWLHSLSQAHLGRWQDTRGSFDRERAEILARECLEIEPRHEESYQVLNALDASGGERSVPAPAKRNAALLTMFSVAMLLTVVVGSMFLWRDVAEDREQRVAAAVEATTPTPAAAAVPTSGSAETKEVDVAVTLDSGSTGLALELESRLSRLVAYGSGKSFYTLNAILANRGDTELDKLGVRLELLDEAGEVIDRESFDAIQKSSPTLRPGDVAAFHKLHETAATVRTARLVLETVEQNPAASTYAAAEPLDFEWRAERTADLEVAMRQRSLRFSENAIAKDGSGFFNVVLEVENTGERTIRALKLEVEILGPDGAWTATDSGYVATSNGPALRPGEIRLERLIEKVAARPDGYRLSVISIQ